MVDDINNKINDPSQSLILIVDDVPANLKILSDILREKGYKISAANCGSQAIEMVNARQPDLILLDIMMPGMDGFEVCKRLKALEKSKNIPIIFLTALTDIKYVVKGFECGSVDYLTKPFNKSELLIRVNTHLHLKNAQKEIIRLEQKNSVYAMILTTHHELKQPLTVLSGNFQLLQNRLKQLDLSDKDFLYLSKMEESIKKIQSLIEKFADSDSFRFENYLDNKKMVVFDDN